ncbi:MAG: response regulator [Thermomicrobiales bacterium]
MTAPIIVLLGNDSTSLAALHALSVTAGYRPLRCRPQEVTDAHAVVKCARADLVILDLWAVRGEDGWAFLRRLWADIDTTHIPTIVITSETGLAPMDGDVLRTLQCQVVRKPLDAAALLRTIAAALRPSPVLRARGTPQPVAPARMAPDDRFLVAADG